ncbi:hypothetical protein D3C81_1680840 [compost metagenome]
MEMQQRFLQLRQAGDPHFGRRERVHPGDDPRAGLIAVRGQDQLVDFVWRRYDRFEHDRESDRRVLVQLFCDDAGMGGHLLQRFRAV